MEELEYYSSNQVARELDIELALLQRLSGLIEKTLMNTDYFYRDKRNRRLYTHANINELEAILTIKKKNKLTYAAAIFGNYANTQHNLSSEEVKKEELSDVLKKLQNQEVVLKQQSEKIDVLTNTIEKLLNLENQNYEALLGLSEKIDTYTSQKKTRPTASKVNVKEKVDSSFVSENERNTKKQTLQTTTATMEIAIQNPSNTKTGTTMIKKAEFLELRKKLKYLPFKWSESRKSLNLSKKDAKHYSQYVNDSKQFLEEVMNPRKLGSYYFIKREQKELLNSYGNFYDTLELTAFPEKK